MAPRRLIRVVVGLVSALVVAVLALVAVVLLTVHPDDFRPDAERALEAASGRKVTLGGPLELSFAPGPVLVAQGVTIANVPWGSRSEWAKVERIEIAAALVPLLSGRLHITQLTLIDADVIVETDKEGRGNWVLGPSGDRQGGSTALRLDAISIEGSRVTWRDGRTGESRVVDIASATLAMPSPDAPLAIDASLSVDGLAGTLKGTLDNTTKLRAGEATAVDLALSAPHLDLTAKGTLGGVSDGTPFDLTVSLDVASAGLLRTFGLVDLPFDGPIRLSAHVSGGLEKLALADLHLAAAGSTVTGSVTAGLQASPPRLSGSLSVDSLDVDALTSGGEGGDDRPGKVFPDDALPFDVLSVLDADLQLAIGTLKVAGLTLTSVTGKLALASGRLDLDPVAATLDKGSLGGSLAADATASPPSVALKLDARSLDVAAVLRDLAATGGVTGTADIAIDAAGHGASVATLMAAASGKASIVMTDGTLEATGLDLFLGGSNAILGGLFEKGSDSAQLSCLAAGWTVDRGVAKQDVLLADTQYATLTGEGTIDLGAETIDETLTPRAKGVALSLAVPVHVGGTLAAPTVTPDEGSLAVKVGTLIGSVFFPPAALLALTDVGLGADHPCVLANRSGGDDGASGVVDAATGAFEGATDAVGGVLDDVGKGLDSLFGD